MSGPRVWGLGLVVLLGALGAGLFLGRTPLFDRSAPREKPKSAAPANVVQTEAATRRNAVEAAERQAVAGQPREFAGNANEGPQREVVELAAPGSAVLSSWTTYDAALAESRQNGKALLLDFNAEWCPPCKRLKGELFDHPVDGREVCTAVIPVSLVDRVRETGANPPELDILQRRFGIDAFPTLVVYSPATGREEKLRGYAGREATLRWIVSAAASVR